jgi:formate hydrogenlyase subunit 3/multisubunit Na+/H+ antiporter MnhD subunit
MSKQVKEKKPKEKQLNLGLKQSPFNILIKQKERFDLFRARWDTKKYTKSNWVWFTIITSISLIITQFVTIKENLNLLPKQVPIFQFYIDNSQRLASDKYIYIMPLLSIFILLLTIIFSNKYYNKERDLSNTLLLISLLSILLITTALIRIINLY